MTTTAYEDLIERHVAAVLAELTVDEQLAAVLFEGDVTGDPDRYVNMFHDTGFYSAHDAQGLPVDVEVTFTLHSVGQDRWQAVWGSGRVTARLLGKVLTIADRRCWRIEHAGGVPVAKNTEVNPPRWIAIDRFTLKSTPA